MSTRSLSLLVALGLATVSTRAFADPKAEAAEHIARAQTAHDAGKFADALQELSTAYTLDPQSQLLYAIGQVHRELGHCDEAITFYKRFLDSHPDAESAEVAKEAITSCKNEPVHKVEQPPPPPPPSRPLPPSVGPTRTPPFYTDLVGDALVGGGAVAGLVGLFEYRSALSDLDSADKAATLDARKQLEDDAHGKRTISVVFAIGGLALVGGGVVHYLVHDRRPADTGVAIVPTSGGGMVTWSGGF
jgi:tetratricopeptide (TPR) repeat protein